MNDFKNLSIKSHLLKHAVEMHAHEEFDTLEFGMRVVRNNKTSFGR